MTEPQRSSVSGRSFIYISMICLIMFWCGCSESEQSSLSDYSQVSSSADLTFEALRGKPPSAKTLYIMADILATQAKDKECEFVLKRCIQQYPQFIPSYNSLAEMQMRQGRVNEATELLSKALKKRPHDPVLQNNLGMCLLVRKEYQMALEHFTKAAGFVPGSEKYRANMATALGLMGRHDESKALLKQILPEEKVEHNAEILRKAHQKATY
ncbi:tetratricopeptide repeat protein [Planctomycetota bacterium]